MRKLLLSIALLPTLAFAQAVLPTSWNFSTPGVSTPPTGWAYNVGTNGNLTYAFGKGDALAGRLDATGENITINFSDKPGILSYYLSPQNAGNPWGGQFDIQESPDGAAWTTVRSVTSKAPTTATNFNDPIYTDSLKETSRWVRFYFTTKVAGGSASIPGGNMAVDLVTITTAPAPALGFRLKQNTTTLVNNTTYVLGNNPSTLFTTTNFGSTTDLRVDSIVISGPNASDFTIGAFDSITPPNNATDTFSVYFNPPLNSGSRFATMKVYSNDVDRSPFTIDFDAVGGSLATEPSAQVPNLAITGLKTHAFNVAFNSAVTEHYIVLRKPAATLTEVPLDGTTYMRGDYIGGAQVAYIGDDTASFIPNYILAKTDYTFAAFTFNGTAGHENYNTTAPAKASVLTPDGQPGTYYNSINPSSPSFITDLRAKIGVVDTIFYSNYIPVMINNYLARDTSGGRKVVSCVYSNDQYVYAEPFIWWTGAAGNPGTQSREHSFAQSWMPTNNGGTWPEVNGKEVSEYHDLHHLFPTNQLTANVKRSNNPFGIVVTPTYTAPTGQGKLGTDANSKTVYEPRDEHKGDLARSLFYMLVRYDGVNSVQWRLPNSQDISVLLQWHQQDPPSPLEIARNNYIGTVQKNRNPFIDHPEWVNRINFSNMTYVPEASAKFVTVTAPNGGETLIAGSTKNITWTSQNIDSVLIEFKANDTIGWKTVRSESAASGSIVWIVPSVSSTTAKVRISDKSNNAVIDSSNTTFTIREPILRLHSPHDDQKLVTGTIHTIKWVSYYIDSVIIEFKPNEGSGWTPVAITPAASQRYDWIVPNILTTSAKIRISPKSSTATADSTKVGFTIQASLVTLTSPLTGTQSLYSGQTTNISWNAINIDSVQIEFKANDSALWKVIASSVNASNGSFAWIVPAIATTTGKIRISDKSNADVFDSCSLLTIHDISLVLTSPLDGETLFGGKVKNITWTSKGVDRVRIDISLNGTIWTSYSRHFSAAEGSFAWTVPATVTNSAKIWITDESNFNITDSSSNLSIVVLPLTLTSPSDGENIVAGATKNITWTSQNIDSVIIEFKANNSIGWSTIAVSAASSGKYTWTVPAIATTTGKIRISDKSNSLIVDSNNAFSILIPELTLTSPVGGEIWTISMPGDGGLVSWTTAHVDSVDIMLYIEDTLFSNLGSFASTLGSVQTVVLPIAPSTTKAKIKLIDPYSGIVSMSPNYFSITNTVGVEELSKNAMKVYPNPSNGFATIELNDLDIDKGLVSVSDVAGRIILEKGIEKRTTIELPTSGFYFIHLQTEKGSLVTKIVVR